MPSGILTYCIRDCMPNTGKVKIIKFSAISSSNVWEVTGCFGLTIFWKTSLLQALLIIIPISRNVENGKRSATILHRISSSRLSKGPSWQISQHTGYTSFWTSRVSDSEISKRIYKCSVVKWVDSKRIEIHIHLSYGLPEKKSTGTTHPTKVNFL